MGYHGEASDRGPAAWAPEDIAHLHRSQIRTSSGGYGVSAPGVEIWAIELERVTLVQETRSAFQDAMQHRFIDVVERLSGRDVLAFISNSHVGPDLEIELFVLGTPTARPSG